MAANCGLACCIYLLMLTSIVTSQKLEDNSSSKYTAEVKEDNNTAQLNFKHLCDQVPNDILKCSRKHGISVLTCNCVTYNVTERLLQVGKCCFNLNQVRYLKLPASGRKLSNRMCEEFNREGTLCGNCKDGHYPLAYSYDINCVECPDGKSNWWKFVLAAFLPLTAFCFIVLHFKIRITSSNLQGFVFYSQIITIPMLVRPAIQAVKTKHLQWPIRVVIAFYEIWNLDFLRSMQLGICLGTDTLQTLALDLAVGVYPLLLMVLSYLLIHLHDRNFRPLLIIWKPFRAIFRNNWDARTSLIDAFATFLVLSNVKLVSASCDLLAPVKVYQLNSTGNLSYSWRVFYNASLPYFGEEHLPYAVLAITVLILFLLLPILLFILYPFLWFQKFLNLFPVCWYILHTFMDSFQGCYKNGTRPGTRDCRWFASAAFIIRFLMFLIGIFTFNAMFYPLVSLLGCFYIIFFLTLEPFKESHQNNVYGLFLCNINIVSVIVQVLFKVVKIQ